MREALEVEAARLFTEMATTEERSELLKLGLRVDAMRSQTETNRFYYLNLHEKLHRRIFRNALRCPALCDAIERTRALSSTWLCVGRAPNGTPSAPPSRPDGSAGGNGSRCVGYSHARARGYKQLQRARSNWSLTSGRARRKGKNLFAQKQFSIELPAVGNQRAFSASLYRRSLNPVTERLAAADLILPFLFVPNWSSALRPAARAQSD